MNINFTGKFILYGEKDTVDKTKSKMKSKSQRFDSFDINLNKTKITIATTGKDCNTFENNSAEPNFKQTICGILKGDKKTIFSKLASYIFGTNRNIMLLEQKTMREMLSYKNSYEDIEYNNGYSPLVKNKRHTIRYADGSSRTFSAKGNEIEQVLADGTKVKEAPSGAKTYTYKSAVVEKFNRNNRLLSRKYPDGTEEFFGKINGKIAKRILPNGKIIHFYYKDGRLSNILDENNNQGHINENGEIIWEKKRPQNEIEETQTLGCWIKITRSGIKQKCVGNKLIEEIFPDGRIKRYNERGITEIYPDGTIKYFDRYGRPLRG